MPQPPPVARARARLEEQGLRIETVELNAEYPEWKVVAPTGREGRYWPMQDQWRCGSKSGRGTRTLIAALCE